ncbi:hypothetical protein CBOM_07991 [Ceraceosorus bombacis]|uniref:Uncharacterized protein n=1 Tax=Ceraceosorus bombacis TaxID=401625 RepID=A0A0P1BIR5_9BASI|nr:hypothetical protein CBOM_07991 [Ceraceosorus bombacis]
MRSSFSFPSCPQEPAEWRAKGRRGAASASTSQSPFDASLASAVFGQGTCKGPRAVPLTLKTWARMEKRGGVGARPTADLSQDRMSPALKSRRQVKSSHRVSRRSK